MSKIQIFESNSQLYVVKSLILICCFRCQRYKFLKAIHNIREYKGLCRLLFPMSKIQIFESNSQQGLLWRGVGCGCFRCQRYKFLKAIHNTQQRWFDTIRLFPMSKIQIFESNSQPCMIYFTIPRSCFRCQRYKFLKAIHNLNICQ